MSDVYMPGVKSRFNSEKLIEDLMKVERIPKERTEKNIENLQAQKGYWQEIGRRISAVGESARSMYSFQNPFGERIAISANESVIGASATREASELQYSFTVKQVAQADRYLSAPLDQKYVIEGGTYTFTVGKEEISFNFRGGSLKEFTDALNRRGRDKISASILTVEPGTRSLLIESKIQGAENRLSFSADALKLALSLGMVEQGNDTRRNIALTDAGVRETSSGQGTVVVRDGTLEAQAGASVSIPFGLAVPPNSPLVLRFETSTSVKPSGMVDIPQPPPGPAIPSPGSVSYGGIVIENDQSKTPLPEWTPPPIPERRDSLAFFSLSFSDGTQAELPAIGDSAAYTQRQFSLDEIARGRTITALNIHNTNTHRDLSLRNIEILDPDSLSGGIKPLNAVSLAQDAVISMEGIEMRRPSNIITDVIPGVTITVRGVSDKPVNLEVQPDREAIKDSIITLVGNYNRLMTELNVLTRNDDRIINEITYLTPDEKEELKKRQGVFSGDSTLNQLKSHLQQAVSSPYPTSEERDLSMLVHIGIGTNIRSASGGAGYDPSRLRGYLEIDEKALDAAIETKLPAIRQLFGSDTSGDLIVDTGVAYNLEQLGRPFVGTGGLISLKTTTLDSRISQDTRRVDTLERQLAAKEADLRIQYGRMEAAYGRMEQMIDSFDNFNQRSGNR
jgi:flagellar hook-associated protein 2